MADGVRRLTAACAAVVLAGAVAGCAAIPSGGAVHYGRSVGQGAGGLDDTDIRLLPPGPRPGQGPREVVAGFLLAAANFDDDHAIARRYLAPAAPKWDADRGVTVYDPESRQLIESARAPSGAVITMVAPQVATIGVDGGYTVAPGRVAKPFRVVRLGAEWRLAEVPPGLLLTPTDVERNLRSVYTYFLNPAQTVVVPDHVFLRAPARGRPTALVRALLDGPTGWLAPAVTTAFPPGTELIGNAPLAGSVVIVNLSAAAARAGPTARAAMSAQLVWTLRQLPEVSGVRITIEGTPLEAPGARLVQSTTDWPTFDPDGAGPGTGFYYVHNRQLVSLDTGAVPGPLGRGALPLERPAVGGPRGDVAAGLRTTVTGSALYAGPLRGVPVVRVRAGRGELTAPSVDPSGAVWTARGGSRPAVLRIAPGGPPAEVTATDLLQLRPVVELRVSRDGTRMAAIVGTGEQRRLVVGRVVVNQLGRTSLEGFRVVAAKLRGPVSLSWADGHRVAVLARVGTSAVPAPWLVETDGSTVTAVGTTGLPLGGPGGLAAGSGDALLVTAAGFIWRSTGGAWARITPGTEPTWSG